MNFRHTLLNCGNETNQQPLDRVLHRAVLTVISLAVIAFTLQTSADEVSTEWQRKVSQITWVAYSPPGANPNKGIEPTPAGIKEDLAALRKAGFTGIVTYGSRGVLGRDLPTIAQSQGFQGMIMGLWDLANEEELSAAKKASNSPIVLGYCVGNEGFPKRYKLKELSNAIQQLREITGKPVTTTEQIDDYVDDDLLKLGDWVFPNAHPYFHSKLEPKAAVMWTVDAFNDLKRRTDRFVMFKEVGLPTAGESEGKLSETGQEQYYLELARTGVRFVYFEAFDLPWKDSLPVEPHWGIFRSDRTPKRLAWRLMGKEPPAEGQTQTSVPTQDVFYVYLDAASEQNHFKPTGYMGDCGDIQINEACEDNPHSGKTCIRVAYAAKGKGPNTCDYPAPCRWAGVYWQEPPNNWGKDVQNKGKGFDLSGYKRLVFWARADKECKIEFKVGGISEPYGDSLSYPRAKIASLNKNWQEYEINLAGADLKHIIGGFCWASNWDTNPDGVTFYLDDIHFEKQNEGMGN
jgi:exo-beta-1,3-glucanase (GH17 family)